MSTKDELFASEGAGNSLDEVLGGLLERAVRAIENNDRADLVAVLRDVSEERTIEFRRALKTALTVRQAMNAANQSVR